MPGRCSIVDGTGGDYKMKVSALGRAAVGPLDFSLFYTAATASNNVAVNVIPPLPGKCFIITDLVLSGDRSIGQDGAITDIYETDSATDTNIVKQIYQDEIAKQTRAVLSGLNIQVTVGKWVNIKSDDVIVRANIAGYYVSTT